MDPTLPNYPSLHRYLHSGKKNSPKDFSNLRKQYHMNYYGCKKQALGSKGFSHKRNGPNPEKFKICQPIITANSAQIQSKKVGLAVLKNTAD